MLMLLVGLGLSESGCTTTPKIVRDDTPSFSETGKQDSGFLGYTDDGHGVIVESARARYNALIAKYGDRFTVPLKPDAGITPYTNGTYLIDPAHNVKAMEMNRWRKSNL